jgi:hypothetical protein
MEGSYYIKIVDGDYLQFGMDGENIIYREVGIVDATAFIWLNAAITQAYMDSIGIATEITH